MLPLPRARSLWPLLACAAACADLGRPPTFPQGAPPTAVVVEQALLGVVTQGEAAGDAVAAQLLAGDGEPSLRLVRLSGRGGPSQALQVAPVVAARAVAEAVQARAREPQALLAGAVRTAWPAVLEAVEQAGARPVNWLEAQPGQRLILPAQLDAEQPAVRVREEGGQDGERAAVAWLGDEPEGPVEAARATVVGPPFGVSLAGAGPALWLQVGSLQPGSPIRRSVVLRLCRLGTVRATLELRRSRLSEEAGDLLNARAHLARALAADPELFEAHYARLQLESSRGTLEAALSALRSAARVDKRTLQVRGRQDPSLVAVRKSAEGRELLGLSRISPADQPLLPLDSPAKGGR